MKKQLFMIIIFLTAFLSGCNNSNSETVDKFYIFNGEVVSVVNQHGKKYHDIKVEYTLTLNKFKPEGDAFKTYEGQFKENEHERHIEITKRTRVYDKTDNPIVTVQPSNIPVGSTIEFMVRIAGDKNVLEAQEISIIKNN